MTADLSLPHQAPELGQYGDCNWDEAAFAVYTLLGDAVSLQDVASALEKQWLEQGNDHHLARSRVVAYGVRRSSKGRLGNEA
jgi:hypothetical protein